MTYHTLAAIIGAEHHDDWTGSEYVPYFHCRNRRHNDSLAFKLSVVWDNCHGLKGSADPFRCYGNPRAMITLFRFDGGMWEDIGAADRKLEAEHAFRLIRMPSAEAYGEVDIEMAILLSALPPGFTEGL
jgi:hypothetical protein